MSALQPSVSFENYWDYPEYNTMNFPNNFYNIFCKLLILLVLKIILQIIQVKFQCVKLYY